MPKYHIRLKLSEHQAYGLESLSIQTGMDYTNLIRRAIDEFIKQNISPENKKHLDEFFATWDNIQESKEKEWIDHVNNMSQERLKNFDTAMKKGIKMLDEKKVILIDTLQQNIPEYCKLDELEQHRIFMLLSQIETRRENPRDELKMKKTLNQVCMMKSRN